MKRWLMLCFWLLCLEFNAWNQTTEEKWAVGELLVQLDDEVKVNDLIDEYRNFELSQPIRLTPSMNIYRLNFNESSNEIESVMTVLRRDNRIFNIQKNWISKLRTRPNDSLINAQWHHWQYNDIDADMDLAWNVTTGGTTINEDTIVIGILDVGIWRNHPDLETNIWKNNKEIVANGIDDDQNGFIDDVWGWNSISKNGDVLPSGATQTHGTIVAGVAGAIGNNEIGVSGINWNIKMMTLRGYKKNDEQIASYAYALKQRQLYNSTNGKKGSFVVAINSSFGTDTAKPEDAPLLCAFFDTLGQHGILSIASGPNENWNIDVVGDLPCTCPSEYIVAVTNIDKYDAKRTDAGYGSAHIDLGAPGTNILSTSMNYSKPIYTESSGTSYSSPMVTGLVGLLYSVPCSRIADSAITHPARTARKIRDYILNGVETNKAMFGITATNGKLNAYNSVMDLVANCPKPNAEELIVFPNPNADGKIWIQYNSSSESAIELEIYDLTGKKVLDLNGKTTIGNNVFRIELGDIANGAYVLKFINGDQTITKKIVI